jgi:hypothetical protein
LAVLDFNFPDPSRHLNYLTTTGRLWLQEFADFFKNTVEKLKNQIETDRIGLQKRVNAPLFNESFLIILF